MGIQNSMPCLIFLGSIQRIIVKYDLAIDDILALLENTAYTSAGIMSRSSQKQAEYAVVLTVSLFARAAIRAGLDPYHAYNLNDLYLQKISETRNVPAYWGILLDALDTYLNEVKKLLATQTRSIHVLHAKQYIGQNLNRTLSLNEIAAEIGLSPNYLSALFTKAEGVGIKEYIILQRIEAAKKPADVFRQGYRDDRHLCRLLFSESFRKTLSRKNRHDAACVSFA